MIKLRRCQKRISSRPRRDWIYRRLLVLFLVGLFCTTGIAPVVSQLPPVSSIGQSVSSEQLLKSGKAFYDKNQFNEAVTAWQEAAQAYEIQGDKLHQAIALTSLSLAYQKLEQWTEAQDAINSSLELIEQAGNEAPSGLILAQALNTRGRLEFTLGKPEAALETWKQATQVYEQADDQTGITGSLLNQAQALESLGLYRRTCKTLLQALRLEQNCDLSNPEKFQTVLQTFKEQPDPQISVLGLRSLGNILRLMGDLGRSQQVLETSLQMAQSPTEKSVTLMSLGKTKRAWYSQFQSLSGRTNLPNEKAIAFEKAIEYANQASDNYQQAAEMAGNSPSAETIQIQAKLHRLSLFLSLQQWLESLNQRQDPPSSPTLASIKSQIESQVNDLLNSPINDLSPSGTAVYAQLNFAQSLMQAREGLQVTGNKLQVNNFQSSEGVVPRFPHGAQWAELLPPPHLRNVRPPESTFNLQPFKYAQKALQEAKTLQDERGESYALGVLGHLYEQTQQWNQAQTLTESALVLAQALQAQDLAYQWQWQLGRIYRVQGEEKKAIAAYETALTSLDSVRKDLLALSPEIQFSFRENVELVYRELVDLLLQPSPTSAEEASQANIQQATQVIDSLQLAELENFLSCDLSERLESPQQTIEPTAALIYPIILEDRLEVILKLPQSEEFRHYTTPLPKAQVEQVLDDWRRELEQLYLSSEGLSLSEQVYNWLIRPLEPALEQNQIKTLVFVLDGSFRNVPMAALYDGQQYLIEKGYATAVIPSLQLLASQPIQRRQLNALAFGLSEVRGDFPPHQGFPPLTNVEAELKEIQSEVPTQELLNQDFTSASLQELVRSLPFPVVHLATHGQFSSKPEETFLLVWDKRLTISDLKTIFQSRSQGSPDGIELLVLSACKTAEGDNRATLGLAGVAVESGARSTLASLWYINDRSTAQLMSDFYQELARNSGTITIAEALRRSQVDLLKTSGYDSPRFWAPYILVGNWQ